MDNIALFILVIGVVAVGMLIVFRDKLKVSLKGFGFSFAAEGSNKDPASGVRNHALPPATAAAGQTAVAAGERAVAAGNKVTIKGPIVTGDGNRINSSD